MKCVNLTILIKSKIALFLSYAKSMSKSYINIVTNTSQLIGTLFTNLNFAFCVYKKIQDKDLLKISYIQKLINSLD
jgi:hypothetical protein